RNAYVTCGAEEGGLLPMQVTVDALHYSMQASKSVPFMQRCQQIATLSRCVVNSPYGSMAWNRKIFSRFIDNDMVNVWTKFYQQIPTHTQESREKIKFRSEKIGAKFADFFITRNRPPMPTFSILSNESRHPRLFTERIRKKFAQATFFPNALKLRKSDRTPLRLHGME
ncbi:MAG: hypothetical protein GY820_01455, partial [Gammaproteobacteria bacterium]|nr:hypothetical protein [Gammaproteobacteria bacterium]